MQLGKSAPYTFDKTITKTTAVVDSGSSYILVPREYFWAFYREIEKVPGVDCSIDFYNTLYCNYTQEIFDQLPEMTFTLSGRQYRVPRESLYVPLDEYDDLMTVEITYIDGWDEWLFGLTFLENYYAVYDMENQRVGFAQSKSSRMSQTSATTKLLASPQPDAESLHLSHATSFGVAAASLIACGLLLRVCRKQKIRSQVEQSDSYKRMLC